MHPKRTLHLAFLLTLLLCAGVLIFISWAFRKPDEHLPFDINGWNAPMSAEHGLFTGVRLRMVDDLLKQYDFHGWTATQVQDLLGQATYDQNEGNIHHLKYDLRDGLKFLIFELDDQAKVVKYFVYMDD